MSTEPVKTTTPLDFGSILPATSSLHPVEFVAQIVASANKKRCLRRFLAAGLVLPFLHAETDVSTRDNQIFTVSPTAKLELKTLLSSFYKIHTKPIFI